MYLYMIKIQHLSYGEGGDLLTYAPIVVKKCPMKIETFVFQITTLSSLLYSKLFIKSSSSSLKY